MFQQIQDKGASITQPLVYIPLLEDRNCDRGRSKRCLHHPTYHHSCFAISLSRRQYKQPTWQSTQHRKDVLVRGLVVKTHNRSLSDLPNISHFSLHDPWQLKGQQVFTTNDRLLSSVTEEFPFRQKGAPH